MAKILVVDDEEDSRKLIAAVLRSSGHNVVEAENGEEAFQMAISENPQLIISDVSMPSMDGMELANVISTNPLTYKIPIILLSAQRIDIKSQREGMALGAREYFVKPFSISEIASTAERLLQEADLKRDMPWA